MTNKETKKQRLCEIHGWTKVCPNICFEMCDDKHTDRCKFYKKPDELPEQIIIRLEAEVKRLRNALKDMLFAYVNKDGDCPHQFEAEELLKGVSK